MNLFSRLFSFAKKTESVDDFVHFILSNGCASVTVTAENSALLPPGMPGVSMFAFSHKEVVGTAYSIYCTAAAPSGKTMEYEHRYVSRWTPPCDYAYDHARNKRETLRIAQQLATMLRDRLATVTVEVLGSGEYEHNGA